MKALESKYIDLANFYKQELLVSQTQGSSNNEHATATGSAKSSKSAVGGVIP